MNTTHKAPLLILLAEDDKDDIYFFKKALAEIPISTQLTIVNDGEELMQYITTDHEFFPVLLFLDLSMPRKNGFECLIEIKQNEQLKNLPVIVLTTSIPRNIHFEETMSKTHTNMGALEYIRKPFNYTELRQIIHTKLTELIDRKMTGDNQ